MHSASCSYIRKFTIRYRIIEEKLLFSRLSEWLPPLGRSLVMRNCSKLLGSVRELISLDQWHTFSSEHQGLGRCWGCSFCFQLWQQTSTQRRGKSRHSECEGMPEGKLPPKQSCWTWTPVDKLLSSAEERLCSPPWLAGTAGAPAMHAALITALLSLLHQCLPPGLLSIPVAAAHHSSD